MSKFGQKNAGSIRNTNRTPAAYSSFKTSSLSPQPVAPSRARVTFQESLVVGTQKQDSSRSQLSIYADGYASVCETCLVKLEGKPKTTQKIVFAELPSSLQREGLMVEVIDPKTQRPDAEVRVKSLSVPNKHLDPSNLNSTRPSEEWFRWLVGKNATVTLAPRNEMDTAKTVRGKIMQVGRDLRYLSMEGEGGKLNFCFDTICQIALAKDGDSSEGQNKKKKKKNDNKDKEEEEEEGVENQPLKSSTTEVVVRPEGEEERANPPLVSSTQVMCDLISSSKVEKEVMIKLRYRMRDLNTSVEYLITVSDPLEFDASSPPEKEKDRTMTINGVLKLVNNASANFERAKIKFVDATMASVKDGPTARSKQKRSKTFNENAPRPTLRYKSMAPNLAYGSVVSDRFEEDDDEEEEEEEEEQEEIAVSPGFDGSFKASSDLVSYEIPYEVSIDSSALLHEFTMFSEDQIPCRLRCVFDTDWGVACAHLVLSWTNKDFLMPPGTHRVSSEQGDVLGDVHMGTLKPNSDFEMVLGKASNLSVDRKVVGERKDKKESNRTITRYAHKEYTLDVSNLKRDRPSTLVFIEHLESETHLVKIDKIEESLAGTLVKTTTNSGSAVEGGVSGSNRVLQFTRREKKPNTQEPDFTTYFIELSVKPAGKLTLYYTISQPISSSS